VTMKPGVFFAASRGEDAEEEDIFTRIR